MKTKLLSLACLFVVPFAAMADEEKIQLKLANAPVGEVLNYYGHLIGKQVVCDNSVQGQVNVVSDGMVSPAQAAELIENSLFLNGFALVDSPSGNLVEVIGLGKPVRSMGVPVYQSLDEFPKHERVVSLIVKLHYTDAQRAQGFMCQYVPPTATTGFVAHPAAGVLVVTGQTSVVRSAVKLLEAIDVPDGGVAAKGEQAPANR